MMGTMAVRVSLSDVVCYKVSACLNGGRYQRDNSVEEDYTPCHNLAPA